MSKIKKVPNNVQGHKTGADQVDPQIIRWRKAIKAKGIILGKASRHKEKVNAKRRAAYAEPDPTKRKFF